MNSLVSYLKTNCASAWSGRVWLDVEGTQVLVPLFFEFIISSIGPHRPQQTKTSIKLLLILAPLMVWSVEFIPLPLNGLPFLDHCHTHTKLHVINTYYFHWLTFIEQPLLFGMLTMIIILPSRTFLHLVGGQPHLPNNTKETPLFAALALTWTGLLSGINHIPYDWESWMFCFGFDLISRPIDNFRKCWLHFIIISKQ